MLGGMPLSLSLSLSLIYAIGFIITDFLDGIHGKIHLLLPEQCVCKAYGISGKKDDKPSPP
jgi:hypothetical protein